MTLHALSRQQLRCSPQLASHYATWDTLRPWNASRVLKFVAGNHMQIMSCKHMYTSLTCSCYPAEAPQTHASSFVPRSMRSVPNHATPLSVWKRIGVTGANPLMAAQDPTKYRDERSRRHTWRNVFPFLGLGRNEFCIRQRTTK